MRNVLIYRLGSLGDTVVALPCFHLIRRAFPNARITLLTNKPVATKAAPLEAVLGSGYFFDEVLNYPVGTRNPFLLARLAWKIRRLKIDTVIFLVAARSAKSTLRDRIFFRLAGVTRIIGCPRVDADFKAVEDPQTGLYRSESARLLDRLQELGQPDLNADEWWDLRLGAEERKAADELVPDAEGEPILVASFGAKAQTKDWTDANWERLFERLTRRFAGWHLVFVGAAEEVERTERYRKLWSGRMTNLCGRASPRVSAAVLKKARLFIGHDSGPMHLAAAVGTPVVAIFAARNLPGQWFPRGRRNRIIYHKTDCFGCNLSECHVEKKKCILGISVEEVETAVLQLMDPAEPVSSPEVNLGRSNRA